MNSFDFHNPVRIVFGPGSASKAGALAAPFGSKAVVVTTRGSVKRLGILDKVIKALDEAGVQSAVLEGVDPNPRLKTVYEGVRICREFGAEMLVAVGGGSVIDCAKAIAVGARYEGDVWEVITRRGKVTGALPFGTVLTLAATGSEMNANSVITNWETQEKLGWSAPPYTYPAFSILDPVYTFTVPKDQTAYGVVDMMSHALEQYFYASSSALLVDRWIEELLRTVMEAGPKAVANPEDYAARETLMFCGTMALNEMLSMGTDGGDWATHGIEHAVSAVYDIPHGGGLAIIQPNWMKYCLDVNPARFARLAVRVFDVDPAGRSEREVGLEGIERLRQFWTSIGAPSRLADYGIGDDQIARMAALATERKGGTIGKFRKLAEADVAEILRMSL